MAGDDRRDVAFDLLVTLAEFTFNRNLPKTSLKIEAALDAFLEETGRPTEVRPVPEYDPQNAARFSPRVPWSRP